MSKPETVPCKSMFSSGTDFMWFLETQCYKCKRLRNGRCRIYSACSRADKSCFPYDDLLDYKGGYGGKLCKSFTDQPIRRMKRDRPIKGQLELEVYNDAGSKTDRT